MNDFSLFRTAGPLRNGEGAARLYRARGGEQLAHVEYDGKRWAYAFPENWPRVEFVEWCKSVGFAAEFKDEKWNIPFVTFIDPMLIARISEEEGR